MQKIKVYIITLCLVLSILFINITPVFCAEYTYYIWFKAGTVENYDLYDASSLKVVVKDNKGNTVSEVTNQNDPSSKSFVYRYVLDSTITYSYELYVNNCLALSNTYKPSSNSYIYVDLPAFSDLDFSTPEIPEDTEKPEDTESSESTESTESTEDTEKPVVNFDDTNINGNLEKISNKLDTFIAIFVFYFGYKIIKEIVNKFERME